MSKLNDLVDIGKTQGFLIRSEILEVLSPFAVDQELVSDIIYLIEKLGIKVLEGVSRERIKAIEERALRKLRKRKDDPDEEAEIA